MSEALFSLHLIYVLVMMEFHRFKLFTVRQELVDQCVFEVCQAIGADSELKQRKPEVYAWRCHTTEDGRDWYYPQEESGINTCNTDSRHVGGQKYDQTGLKVTSYQCLLAVDFPDASVLEILISRVIRPYVLEEARYRSDFERDLRGAERDLEDFYKKKAEGRLEQQRLALKSGAS